MVSRLHFSVSLSLRAVASFVSLVAVSACSSSESNKAPACGEALFCDDFESYAVGAAPLGDWKARVASGTIAVDSARHNSGKNAVRASTNAGGGTKTAFLRLAEPVLPISTNSVYGRFYMYLESAPSTDVHFTVLQGGGKVGTEAYQALYRYGGQHPVTDGTNFVGAQWMANYETPDSYSGVGPKSDCWHHANKKVVPTARWACIEWQFDGPANTLRLWQDGKEMPDLTVVDSGDGCVGNLGGFQWTAPQFEYLELGFESYQTDEARVMYVDDVAVSDQRVGCGK